MKLLIATPLYPPEIGGPATYAKILEKRLPERGFAVSVLAFGRFRRYPKGIKHFLYFLYALKRARQADAVLALDPVSVGLPAALAAKIARKPFFVKIVGDYAWEQGKQRFGITSTLDDFVEAGASAHFFVRMLQKVENFVARSAKHIIVPSNYLRGIVLHWGVPAQRISVVYNSFDAPSDPGNRETLRGLLQFNGSLAVSVGRLVPWKGFSELIDATKYIVGKVPDYKLLIVGDGPLRDALERQVEEHGLGEHVALTGTLPKDVLIRYLTASDAFVLNTSYEGFSHQILEAMALSVPVVTTRIGGNPELIENETEGLLVEYGDVYALADALIRVLSKSSVRSKLIACGKKKAQQFTEERMVAATEKVLRKA